MLAASGGAYSLCAKVQPFAYCFLLTWEGGGPVASTFRLPCSDAREPFLLRLRAQGFLSSGANDDQGTTLMRLLVIQSGMTGAFLPACTAITRFPSSRLFSTSHFTHWLL